MDNEAKLKSVLADVLDMEASQVNKETSMDTVEAWDSLKHLNVILALEEGFDITLEEEESVMVISYPLIKDILVGHGVNF